jgi:site-specific DNA recombinase
MEDIRALAEREGWLLIDPPFVDNSISAYSGRVRPAYRRLLDEIEAGHVDVVVAWDLDRLNRRMVDLVGFIELVARKQVLVKTVTAGSLDLSTPAGQLIAHQLGSVAQYESAHKSERLSRSRLQAARQGRRAAGPRQFGYEPGGLRIRRREASAIRKAAADVLNGAPVYRIVKKWNTSELLTTRGNTWTSSTLTDMLRQPSLAALRVYGPTGETMPGSWPAILTEDQHALLKLRLQSSGSKPSRRRGLLSGVARCAICSRPLAYARQTEERWRYTCDRSRNGGCGTVTVAQGRALEAAVIAWCALHDQELITHLVGAGADRSMAERDALLRQLRAVEDRRTEFFEMLRAGELTRGEYNVARMGLVEEREALEVELRASGADSEQQILARMKLTSAYLGGHVLAPEEVDTMREAIRASLPSGAIYVRPGVRRARTFNPAERLELR